MQPLKSGLAAANSTFLRAQHSFSYVELHITEGAGLLSSPRPREQGRSGRNAPACARAAGQRSLSNRVTAGAN